MYIGNDLSDSWDPLLFKKLQTVFLFLLQDIDMNIFEILVGKSRIKNLA